MKLQKWQKLNGMSNLALAKLLGCDVSMIYYYHNKTKNFSPKMARKIKKKTAGQVTEMEVLYR